MKTEWLKVIYSHIHILDQTHMPFLPSHMPLYVPVCLHSLHISDTMLGLCKDTLHNPSIVSEIWSSALCNGWGRKTTQILPLNVKDRNYSISGPSPPSIPRVSTYLCEFMPSYCTPNPGAYLLILLYIGHLTKGHKNPSKLVSDIFTSQMTQNDS